MEKIFDDWLCRWMSIELIRRKQKEDVGSPIWMTYGKGLTDICSFGQHVARNRKVACAAGLGRYVERQPVHQTNL